MCGFGLQGLGDVGYGWLWRVCREGGMTVPVRWPGGCMDCCV